jgi:hypothetical protein
MEVIILTLIVVLSLFFDYMLYLHFNALFEDQFSLTNKLILMVNPSKEDTETNYDQTTLESFTGED